MLWTGGASFVLGAIVWLADTDFDTSTFSRGADDSSPVGQFIGTAFGTAGLLLPVLGWTAAVICRQILDARSGDSERS